MKILLSNQIEMYVQHSILIEHEDTMYQIFTNEDGLNIHKVSCKDYYSENSDGKWEVAEWIPEVYESSK